MKNICFVTHTSGGASYDMEFGERKFLSLREYPQLICYEDSYEKDEIMRKLVNFLQLVNGKCNVIKKAKCYKGDVFMRVTVQCPYCGTMISTSTGSNTSCPHCKAKIVIGPDGTIIKSSPVK